MRPSEAAVILAAAARFDRRKLGENPAEDEATAVAWASAIGDLRLVDCLAAVDRHYAESSEWLKPAHVRDLVRRIRAERAERAYPPQPPNGLDGPAYLAWLRETNRRLGDGEHPNAPELPARPVGELLAGAFRKVPSR